jgi:cyclophilin family peptidyl-prolyl cis-trans isomerase
MGRSDPRTRESVRHRAPGEGFPTLFVLGDRTLAGIEGRISGLATGSASFPPDACRRPGQGVEARTGSAGFLSSPLSESRVSVGKLLLKVVAIPSLAVGVPAATGLTAAAKPSTNVLVPASSAKAAGFTEVVRAPSASTATSVTGCPDGSQEEFGNTSEKLGLISEVLYCSTTAAAKTLLKNVASSGKAPAGQSPPKGLGSTAVERAAQGSNYIIAWQRGNAFELTALTPDTSSSTTSTTTPPTVPLTAHDQQVLANAATQQNGRFQSLAVSSGTGSSAADAKAQSAANTASVAAGCPKSPTKALSKSKWSSAPAVTIDPTKTYKATVKTDVGSFVISLDAKDARTTVNNFVFLAQHGFFNCVTFLRVIPTFVDQTGDPTGTGSGGPGYTIPDELPAKASNAADQYPLGSVAMANTGQPHTGGSQWFVVAGAEGESLPATYSLFGLVTSGMSVVKKINAQGSASGVPPDVTHRMLKVTISSS